MSYESVYRAETPLWVSYLSEECQHTHAHAWTHTLPHKPSHTICHLYCSYCLSPFIYISCCHTHPHTNTGRPDQIYGKPATKTEAFDSSEKNQQVNILHSSTVPLICRQIKMSHRVANGGPRQSCFSCSSMVQTVIAYANQSQGCARLSFFITKTTGYDSLSTLLEKCVSMTYR